MHKQANWHPGRWVSADQVTLCIAIAVGGYTLGVLASARSATIATSTVPDEHLTGVATPHHSPTPSLWIGEIDFGAIPCGGYRSRLAWLKNDSNSAVVIRQLKTSCACVDVLHAARELRPGDRIPVLLVLDTSEEPDFEGGLAVKVSLLQEGGKETQIGTVAAEVSADDRLIAVAKMEPGSR